MGAKGFVYAGLLPGTGKPVSSSARCIIYDHQRELLYLSTDNPRLARDVAYAQRLRDSNGVYKAYQWAGEGWEEIRIDLPPESSRAGQPPLFV
jgi:hypothetical protein